MSRIALAALLLALPLLPLAAAEPHDDAGTGCDAGNTPETAIPITSGTYSGTVGGWGVDEVDFYRIAIPPGPHAVKLAISSPDFHFADLIDPEGWYRTGAYPGVYDGRAVGSPSGDWYVGVGPYGAFSSEVRGCDPGPGDASPYTFTITVEPREHIATFVRPPASMGALVADMPASSGAMVEGLDYWSGNAEWEGRAFSVDRADGTSCGYVRFEHDGSEPTTVGVAGRRVLGGASGFMHHAGWLLDSERFRTFRAAWSTSATVSGSFIAVWNGDEFSLTFPDAFMAEMDAGSFDSLLVAKSGWPEFLLPPAPSQSVLVDATLAFGLDGATRAVTIDPGRASAPSLVLTRPGQEPVAVTGPVEFRDAEAPAGEWRLHADAHVSVGGPVVRVLGLPWATPVTTCTW